MNPNPNMAPAPVAPDAQAPPAPAAPPAAPQTPADYEALYRKEVQERIAERQRYKPFEQTVGALDPESQQAFLALARAAAEGDTEAIKEWSASTYKNLSGAEIAAQVAAATTAPAGQAPAGVTAPTATPAAPSTEGLTAQQVQDMVAQQIRREQMVQQINSELAAAGYQADSPSGRTILAHAHATRASIADAVAWYNADLAAQYARSVAAGQAVAGATPPPAPAGTPGATPTPLTGREAALARLTGNRPA
jgi:hypothetical protein